MKLLSKKDELNFLNSEFSEIRFELFTSDNLKLINCIACFCQTAKEVALHWREIQSLISVYFQPAGKYEKWNIYLVFFCTGNLDFREKYTIQNDKYAVRKIVLDGLNFVPDSDGAAIMINVELLGSDLSLVQIDHVKHIEMDQALSNLISGAPSDMSVISKDRRITMIDNIIKNLNSNEN